MKIGLALTFGILYWLATNKLWYGTLHLVRQPIVLAVPIGLIMGNLPDAMIMGASLQMIYLGAIAPGGTLPSDEALSSCIAIPLALQAGLDPSIAVTLAVPIGLLGVLIDNLKRTYMSFFVHIADKAVEENNVKKMLLGVDAVSAFLDAIPAWATNGLSVAGGLLPALGFAVTIMVIGKKNLIPYFIIGFALVAYSGMNTIGVAVLAICIALLQGNFVHSDEQAAQTVYADDADDLEGDI